MNIKIFCRLACFLPGRAKDLPAPLYDETSDRDRTAKDTVLLLSGERNTNFVAFVHKVFCLRNVLCKFKVEKVLAYFCDLLHVLVILLPLRHLPVSQM